MKVLALCCTHNRFTFLQRSLRSFLDQRYEGEATLLIYNNGEPFSLGITEPLPPNRSIILVNNNTDKYTKGPYTDVGSIFRDALHAAPPIDLVVHWDDDDLILPDHIEEGVKGYKRGLEANPNCKAYKPYYSYFKGVNGVEKICGILEPSIFVSYSYLMEAGYAPVNVKYHQRWLDPIERAGDIFSDPDGPSTWVYDWSPAVHHISGAPDGYSNFMAHHQKSTDTGAGRPLTPLESNTNSYNLIYGTL